MEQNIRLDVNHMMADMLGGEYGVTQAQLAAMQDAAMKAQHAVEANRGTGWLGWMNLPYNQEEIVSEIEKVATISANGASASSWGAAVPSCVTLAVPSLWAAHASGSLTALSGIRSSSRGAVCA